MGFPSGFPAGSNNYDVLLKLNLNSLKHLRTELSPCFLHKLLSGAIYCPDLLKLVNFNTNKMKLFQKYLVLRILTMLRNIWHIFNIF